MNLSCSDLNHGKYAVLILFKMITNRFSVSFPSMRFMFRDVARIFQRGGHTVSHPGCVLLKVIFFRLSSERGGGTSLQNSCIDELSST